MEYNIDFLTGGTVSVSSQSANVGTNSVDDSTGTVWLSNNASPSWWKYDLGASVSKKARKLRIFPYVDGSGGSVRAFTLSGSNDDSSYTTITTGEVANSSDWSEFTFSNTVSYRYYKVDITTDWRGGDNFQGFAEIELMEELVRGGYILFQA